MEGKRFGFGLAAGILLALAIVAASGGLGSTPFTGSFAPSAASSSSTTTVAYSAITTATVTMSTTSAPPGVTYTLSVPTTTGGSESSLNSSAGYPSNSISSSSITVTSTASAILSVISNSTPGGQTAATSAANGTPFGFLFPSGVNRPTQLASITRQPVVTNAEILAPVLVAFLLGAFLYRIAVQDREKSSGD